MIKEGITLMDHGQAGWGISNKGLGREQIVKLPKRSRAQHRSPTHVTVTVFLQMKTKKASEYPDPALCQKEQISPCALLRPGQKSTGDLENSIY